MKILILGATGAAGGSLLDAALASPAVTEVRTISRRPIETGIAKHASFRHDDLLDCRPVGEAFAGIDACFYCVGRAVALVKDEAEYRKLAVKYPLAVARELDARSPAAYFHYLSGQGANLQSRQMWARVKAEAEQILIKEHGAICWRPGAIDAKRTAGWPAFYKVVIPLMRWLAPSPRVYVKGEALAGAMLLTAVAGPRGRIIDNVEIRKIAEAAPAG
ncbi:MAG TPA: hypothetical protein VG734_19350 [Lacunisphaera sp.]|nr:hypothetical protein [Lacunisphaera sp.]